MSHINVAAVFYSVLQEYVILTLFLIKLNRVLKDKSKNQM